MKKRPIRNFVDLKTAKFDQINWRVAWYSVFIWILVILIGSFVILPWFYLVLPIFIVWSTVFYFKKSDKTFRTGLWVALFWFSVIAALDFLEIVGPYYSNTTLYFSDFRNWLKYPLVLLAPVIYSLILEGLRIRKGQFGKNLRSNFGTRAVRLKSA